MLDPHCALCSVPAEGACTDCGFAFCDDHGYAHICGLTDIEKQRRSNAAEMLLVAERRAHGSAIALIDCAREAIAALQNTVQPMQAIYAARKALEPVVRCPYPDEQGWRPMANAGRDGTRLLALLDGSLTVVSWSDNGWSVHVTITPRPALPIGEYFLPDSAFAGWMPLPQSAAETQSS